MADCDPNTKLKILWIYPDLPYPLTSGLLRGFHLLQQMGKRHAVTFVCLTKQWPVPSEAVEVLSACAERVIIVSTQAASKPRWAELVRHVPLIGWRICEARELKLALKQMKLEMQGLLKQQSFSVLLFSGREALPVLQGLKEPIVVECGDTNSARILQQMHCVSLAKRPRFFYRYMRERRLEKKLANTTPYRCFITARDRVNLLGASDQSEIVPQGVDCDYWNRTLPPSGKNCIVFTGVMDYPPNADAALLLIEQVLPFVRQEIPELEVLIVGRDPLPELRDAVRPYSDVTVVGTVPDVRPYLERADVFVAAIRFASGIQNKVLEAMAMEVPVVTTPVVVSGLRIDGLEPPLLTGNVPREIADSVIRILTHTEERARLAIEGRRFVKTHYSWSASADKLEKLCMAAAMNQSDARKSAATQPMLKPSTST